MTLEITWSGDFSHPQANRLKQAFDNIPKHNVLTEHLLRLPGGSGVDYRKMINNLISITPDSRYLEVGSLYGSTACSAMYKNKLSVTCIDNFSWNNKPQFLENVNSIITNDIDLKVIHSDFRQVDYSTIGKYNFYMYDGPHDEHDQYDGVVIAQPALDDCFTLIVDDYNSPPAQQGTQKAIKNLGLTEIASLQIITPREYPRGQDSDWHFGYYIAILQK